MKRVPFARGVLALAGLALGVITISSSAHADRVISDLEASKLTFASLTAPPPVVHAHRYARRVASSRYASHKTALATAQHGKMVRLVSYHQAPHAIHSKHHRRT